MKYFVLAVMLMTGFLCGCTVYQIDSKDTTLDFYPPKKSIEDVGYMEKIDRPYEEIGVVSVTTERRQSLEDVLPKLKYEAAVLGGDAITDVQSNSGIGTWKNIKLQKFLANANIRTKYTAKVVVLK